MLNGGVDKFYVRPLGYNAGGKNVINDRGPFRRKKRESTPSWSFVDFFCVWKDASDVSSWGCTAGVTSYVVFVLYPIYGSWRVQ